MKNEFEVNQIVKGQVCGTFIIVGFETIAGESLARLKAVNPNDHAQTAPGGLCLPLDAIEAL